MLGTDPVLPRNFGNNRATMAPGSRPSRFEIVVAVRLGGVFDQIARMMQAAPRSDEGNCRRNKSTKPLCKT
jgi:tripartite-type tricarboxylate transporter receptor subunit TctC